MDAVGERERDLHEAVKNRDMEKIRFLLEQGVYIKATNAKGETPLDLAIQGGDLQICKILGEYLAVPVCLTEEYSTLLHYAVYSQKEHIVRLPLENGTDVNTTDSDGNTPLHHAAGKTKSNIIRLLLEKGADIKAVNYHGETPLHEAARLNFNRDNIKLLIECGADVNASDIDGETPLHTVVGGHSPEIVGLLLAAGADVNATNREGDTALHVAIKIAVMGSLIPQRILELICHFVVSLQVADLHVSEQNIQAMSRIRDKFKKFHWYSSFVRKLDSHKLECEQELERIKTRLKSGLSLKYIVTTNNPRHLQNETLAQQLESINIYDFPIYGNLLKRKLVINRKKLLLLDEAIKALGVLLARDRRIMQLVIPSELLEKILCYLKNGELRNLISCAGPN